VTEEAKAFWQRAIRTLDAARKNLLIDPDTAASRAYYAALYAVSAHFALQGKTFEKHTALEAAVHRDLVRPGIWPKELGGAYTRLMQIRARGDYGGAKHVSPDAAEEAVHAAADIARAVAQINPVEFADRSGQS
jgi:uncharacterized protein (UPF0332 family)